jgi:succinoglycan biosynthesis protein ExoO
MPDFSAHPSRIPPTPPRVSVLVPLYNSAATIERCLLSALRQTMRDIEILVADDCSTDDGPAIVRRMADQDDRIRLIPLPRNGGKPHAMNVMVAQATGIWVAVLDADDAYHPTRLERLLDEAEANGVAMAADNILYVDAGVDQAVQHGFDPAEPSRKIEKSDFLRNSSSHGTFDFGILKPVIRRDFLLAHKLTYFEQTRLAEDFYYLMNFFAVGGTGWLVSAPLYFWTMPFGAVSRAWTSTGSGAWRYNYREALVANQHYIGLMQAAGETDIVALLRERDRQYKVMVHYLDAQRLAASGARVGALLTIARHPSTWPLLTSRVTGRLTRGFRKPDAQTTVDPTAHRQQAGALGPAQRSPTQRSPTQRSPAP